MEEDLHQAAHYYLMAGERHQSARANFNLGFMHQWGLGLKQDFPMAKRHYDLALSRNHRESEIAVQIALFAMNTHEFAIRWKVLIEDWWNDRSIYVIYTKHIKILTRFSLQLGKIMEDKGKMDELIEQMKLMNVLLS